MPKSRGTLEFADARRSPVELPVDMIIGRAAGSRLRLYDNGVADKHAQITVDDDGAVWILDLESPQGTLRNGERVQGKQRLADGDKLQLGPTVLIFRASAEAKAAAAAPKPAPVAAPKPAAPVEAPKPAPRVAAGDRTMVPQELPPEVRAFVKAREEALAAQKTGVKPAAPEAPKPPAKNAIVGAAEPEPTDHRTLQMDAGEVERLMAARGITAPAPSPQAKAQGTLTMDAAEIERQLVSEQIIAAPTAAPETGNKATTQMDSDEINRLWAQETLRARIEEPVRAAPLPPPPGAQAAAAPPSKPVDTQEMQAVIAPQSGFVSGHAVTAEFDHPPGQAAQPVSRNTLQGYPAANTKRSSPDMTPTGIVDSPSPTGRRRVSSPDVTPTDIVDPLPAPSSSRQLADAGVPTFKPAVQPAPVQPPAPTMMAPAPVVAKPAPLATAPTMMGVAPVLPKPSGTAPTAPTMMAVAPNTPAPAPAPAPVQAPTMMAPSPAPVPQNVPAPVGYQATAPVDPLPPPQQPPYQQQPQYQQQQQQQQQYQQHQAYTPPKKGSFGSFSRAFEFMGQMISLARQNKIIIRPLILDLLITTPLSIAIAACLFFVSSSAGAYAVLSVGTAMLYFVDYACNSLTASLIFDHVTTGNAQMSSASARVKKALPGIMVFAAVSALLDVASTYARERRDVLSRILINILRSIWTTATYIIMPSLVIEGVSFGVALKRSKELMSQDPTGVGAGVVAMSITSYIAAIVIFPTAYFMLRFGGLVHPVLGAVLFFLLVNLYWSVSGWMKISYATCFYLWARECERTKSQDHALAPLPLRTALDAG